MNTHTSQNPGASGKLDVSGKILNSNPHVDKHVVRQYQELEKKLNALGIDTKPRYRISSPHDRAAMRRFWKKYRADRGLQDKGLNR